MAQVASQPYVAGLRRSPNSRGDSCHCESLTGEARTVRMRRVCTATRPAGRGAAVRCTRTARRLITGAVVVMAAIVADCRSAGAGSEIMQGLQNARQRARGRVKMYYAISLHKRLSRHR